MNEQERMARAFKALSNPNRLKIYQALLREGAADRRSELPKAHAEGCLLAEAAKRLKVGAPTVSHHIRELVEAELITATREGRQLFCAVNLQMRDKIAKFFLEQGK
jgi:DNA-binding transcriptional ArsR family regulator